MRTLLRTIHISAGSLALLTGPAAMLAPKRAGTPLIAWRSFRAAVPQRQASA
jgi:hypothetical protein